MRFLISSVVCSGLCLASIPAFAQTNSVTTPAPAAVKAAREVVAQMQGDRATVLRAMSAPMMTFIQQMGVREPDRAQVLVQEVVMPVLTAHYDDLLDVQSKSYANALSVADLQTVSTFYGTPAGRNLAAAQPTIAQAQLTGMTQWMSTLVPEIQTKMAQAIQTHGWGPGKK